MSARARNIMARCGICGHKEALHIRTIQFGTAQMGDTAIEDACADSWVLTAVDNNWVQQGKSCTCTGFQEKVELRALPPDSGKSDWGLCGMKGCTKPAHPDYQYSSVITFGERRIKIRTYLCVSDGLKCSVAIRTYDPVKWKPSFEGSRLRAWDEATGKPVAWSDLKASP